ncbi:MAG: hypothetical protein Q7W38_02665 [Deltaproteobacteria bacterium]|nr:hypothetical protein [Deltaproteobacteria bacterium]
MKKVLIVLVALLAMVAFVSGVVAQEKKAETPAAAADKPKADTDKPKAPEALKASGAVVAYEAGKTITVKTKDKELAFDIAADAKVKGEVKEGAKVTVTYKKDGDKMVATAISVAAAKKAKAPKAEKK